MVESIAMLEYVIARYGPRNLAPAASDAAFPAYLQFLHLGEAGLAAYLNICVASRFFAPEGARENFGAAAAERMFFGRLALVSARLGQADYLAGDRFSAADISVAYALDLAERLGLADRFGPELQAYRARLADRPAFQAASAKSPPPG
jgi:glutathione S-transferase/3-isopropylmalate dehydratase